MAVESVLASIAEYAAKKLADKLFAPRERGTVPPRAAIEARIEEALPRHLQRVVNWSASVQFLRMPSARDVEHETIALSFNAAPRRFRAAHSAGQVLGETELLASARHIVLLGAPGAGKTTTLKRICRLLLSEESTGAMDSFQTPLVILLRTLERNEFDEYALLAQIAREIGLKVRVPEARITAARPAGDGTPAREEIVKRERPLCEERPIDEILPKILDQLNALVLLDGLDEIGPSLRAQVEADIETLLHNGERYKVIATCRSGDYLHPVGYMSAVEVCDLESADIETLADRWLGARRDGFLAKLGKPSLRELASRPLFLTHMLTLYDLDGTLPEQPFEVYELVVMLMIKEWDRERKLHRPSRYADFGPEKKLRFLAAIAYELTYSACIKVFTRRNLLAIYAKLHAHFGLPEDEAELVATELESHTGIIVESGAHTYEFSHLTVQEYLCAEHLVRCPFPQAAVGRLLEQYPAPLAVAAALSADPAAWVAGILLNERLFRADSFEAIGQQLDLFLGRLEIENPIFAHSGAIGCCVLALAMHAAAQPRLQRLRQHVDRLVARPVVKRSLVDILTTIYTTRVDLDDTTFYRVQRIDGERLGALAPMELPYGIALPDNGRIQRAWLETALADELAFDGRTIARRAPARAPA